MEQIRHQNVELDVVYFAGDWVVKANNHVLAQNPIKEVAISQALEVWDCASDRKISFWDARKYCRHL